MHSTGLTRYSCRQAWSLALLVLFATALATLAFAQSFPALSGRVVDQAGIISQDAQSQLTERLRTLEDKSGIQLVVATVKSLDGNDIETYANKLFRNWKLGEAKNNNGVLLLVAPNERKVRIEVGYGLEGTLTDALSKLIIVNAIAPRFKAGDFSGGVDRGTQDIITVLTTDSSEWAKRPQFRQQEEGIKIDFAVVMFALIMILFIYLSMRRNETTQRGRWTRGSNGGVFLPTDGRGFPGGWGGGWSGGSSDSGSWGGGFSGGGGSSGGGGASGDW